MTTTNYFNTKYESGGNNLPPLPVCHTCDAFFIESILQNMQLRPVYCNVFKQDLSYFFNGKPAYKSPNDQNSSLTFFLPACFILKPEALTDIRRIIPFDSGAFKKGLYKKFLHPKMKMEDFFMEPCFEAVLQHISYFFGTNAQYFHGLAKKDVSFDPLNFVIEAFYKLICDPGISAADDRRGVIEIQCGSSVSLTKNNLMAVVLPEHLKSAKMIQEVLVEELNIPILSYKKSFGIGSASYYAKILELVEEFLTHKNLLNGTE